MKFSFLNNPLPKITLLFTAIALFLVSLFTAWYFQKKPSLDYERWMLEHYIHSQQEAIEETMADTSLIRKLVLKEESMKEFRKILDVDYGFFLFAETISGEHELLFWNNQKILPPAADFTLPDGEYFQQLANGYYVIIKKRLKVTGMSNNLVGYAMIPVLHQYYLETPYLPTRFAHDKNAIKKIYISDKPTANVIKSIHNKPLFFLERRAFTAFTITDTLTIVLRLSALIFLLVYVHFMAEDVVRKRGPKYGTVFLAIMLVICRVLLFQFPQVFSFRQFPLFDPAVYATNNVNASLGDLLINAVMFCWVVMFAWYQIGPIKRLPKFLTQKKLYVFIAGVIAVFVLIFSTFQLANVVRGMVANSQISFNVTDFFSLDPLYTVAGFIVFALLSLSYYYFSRLLFRFIYPAFESNSVYVYFFIALVGLGFLGLRTGNPIVLFHLPVLVWLIIYTLLLSQEQFIINRFRITIAGALFWIFIFSISLSVIILKENDRKEWIQRTGIAEKYDRLSDPSSENILSIAITYLDNRFLANNFYRFRNPAQNRFIRDSIIRENFRGYVNKYETQIHVFDTNNAPLNNADSISYAELNTIFTMQSKPTGIPDLYYHESSFDKLTYITKREIPGNGTFFIISNPRQYNREALYPELFRQASNDLENSAVYSYAIYEDGLLISSSTKYPFSTQLDVSQLSKAEVEKRYSDDYDELWYRASNKKIVVIAKKQDSLLEGITMFSYLFCAFLFMVGLIRFIALVLHAANERLGFSVFWQLNIRSQIHGTVIFISVLSFLIIGGATISFFISRYNRNNIDKLSRTAGIMVKEMQKRLSEHGTFDDVIKIYDTVANENLSKLTREVANIHNVDVNVYNLDGDLNVSSDQQVYTQGILSTKMHPEAYFHLNRLNQVQYVQQETMSSLNYLSIYAAVRDEEGRTYAFLNIPYFSSQIDLQQEISNFLVTIINLNAFIFLIAGVIALFITNKITRSFSVIGDKMKAITLGGRNEEIVWTRKDEIGELVTQYNKMVHQLEQSAEALAKSEREGAWREMARQVAHEIKNPLTPMKLSIQYLQKSIDSNKGNVKELTANVANTLIEQIDHLSKIAADFSQFANIGIKKIETIDLHLVLQSLVSLFQANPKVLINWERYEGSLVLRADKTHMNRLFTNLLSNAVEACQMKEACRINLKEQKGENEVLITLSDNGEGIPEEMQSKIFTPNFTTKTSGTGLGLAMCKSIVEQANGSIWFETDPGKGTTFFIRLPLIN